MQLLTASALEAVASAAACPSSRRKPCPHVRSRSGPSCRRGGRPSSSTSTAPKPSGPRRSRSPSSPIASATTRSGSTTTSTTCPDRPTRPCSSAGRPSPPSASGRHGCASARWSGARPYRNPGLLAKITSNIDVISGGRLDWGIGAGWYEHEFRGYGYEFLPAKDRIAVLRRDRRDRAVDVDRARHLLRRHVLPARRRAVRPQAAAAAAPADPHRGQRRAAHAAGGGPAGRPVELRRQPRRVRPQVRRPAPPLRRRRPRLRRDREDLDAEHPRARDRGRGAGDRGFARLRRAVRQLAGRQPGRDARNR